MKQYELISVFTYTLAKLVPKKRDRWIFGSWFGTACSDNTKAFFEYIEKNCPEIETVWVTNNPQNVNIKNGIAVKRNSVQSLWYILTAEVAVMNQGFGDFSAYNLLGGCYKVQLWHGVAWKKIVWDAMPKPVNLREKIYQKIFRYINQYDLYITTSPKYESIVKSAFQTSSDHIVCSGQPRNEALFDESFCKSAKKYILQKIGEKEKKIVVYMPTFRDKKEEVFSFGQKENVERIMRLAKKYNFVIIEKSHFKKNVGRHQDNFEMKSVVYTMPTEDAQTLLASADILITDYSSCFFDFTIRNKPIIHFAYDYDYYKNRDRGLYFDIDEVAAGSIAYNFEELEDAIVKNLNDEMLYERKRKKVMQDFLSFESSNNSQIIFDRIKKDIRRG